MGFSRRLGKLGLKNYETYLASPHWQEFRERYRRSDLVQACAVCGATNYQLHHKTYVRLGKELLEDVVPLCRTCHEDVHALLKAGPVFVEFTWWALDLLKARRQGTPEPPTPEKKGRPSEQPASRQSKRSASRQRKKLCGQTVAAHQGEHIPQINPAKRARRMAYEAQEAEQRRAAKEARRLRLQAGRKQKAEALKEATADRQRKETVALYRKLLPSQGWTISHAEAGQPEFYEAVARHVRAYRERKEAEVLAQLATRNGLPAEPVGPCATRAKTASRNAKPQPPGAAEARASNAARLRALGLR